ncbi:MAG: DUF302 domain-containing protein [Saccharolobus sp.]
MLVTKKCNLSFKECVEKLKKVIKDNGAEVFTIIDHDENAKKVGLTLGPTVVIYFGNPRVGTLLMIENREMAYELPLRVVVWEENGNVIIGYKKPSELGKEYGITRNVDILRKMDEFMANIINSI